MDADQQQTPRASEAEHARLILDTANDAFISIDEAGVIVDWNKAAERTLGWPRERALGLSLAETIIPERFRTAHLQGLRRLVETGQGPALFQTLELSALDRAGHEFPIELTIWPSQVAGRWRFNAFLRDISERVRMQDHVRLLQRVTAAANAAEDLQEAMDTALAEVAELTGWPVGHVYVRGFNQQRLEPTGWWTPAAAPYERFRAVTAATGFVEGEGLPGRVVADRRPALIADVADDDNFPRGEIATAEGLVGAFAFPVLSGPRVVAVLEFYSTRSDLPDGQLLQLMADIGIQLGRVFERLRWQHELQTALETKKRLLSMLAHEVRTPAVVIGGFADLLLEDLDDLDESELRDHLGSIHHHVDRLQRLVTNALQASRIEAGQLEANPRPLQVAPRLRQLLAGLNLAHDIAIEGDTQLVAEVDPDHFEQMLTNYLANADLYGAPPIWIELDAQMHHEDGSPPRGVIIRVCDRGPGVDPSFATELFRSFRRGTTASGGSGLGLSIVRDLAHLNHGDAWHEPLTPHGAAFVLRLPVSPETT